MATVRCLCNGIRSFPVSNRRPNLALAATNPSASHPPWGSIAAPVPENLPPVSCRCLRLAQLVPRSCIRGKYSHPARTTFHQRRSLPESAPSAHRWYRYIPARHFLDCAWLRGGRQRGRTDTIRVPRGRRDGKITTVQILLHRMVWRGWHRQACRVRLLATSSIFGATSGRRGPSGDVPTNKAGCRRGRGEMVSA